ncbi:MAG: Tex family protein, partial [Fibrobacterota bacterium]
MDHSELISKETGIERPLINAVGVLLDEGGTVPFIARYRKEKTGNMDETVILSVKKRFEELKDIEDRKNTIKKTIDSQGKLTQDLKEKIDGCFDKALLEDIYLPYKPKRRTRAEAAREKGLSELADFLLECPVAGIMEKASEFLSEKVETADEAVMGACDIIAENVNENAKVRDALRTLIFTTSSVVSKVKKNKEKEAASYRDYFSYSESARTIPSHRILAIMRGEKEGFLSYAISFDEEKAARTAAEIFFKEIKKRAEGESRDLLLKTVDDSMQRLMFPSITGELKWELKKKADEDAIKVFSENLRNVLLSPPAGEKGVIGLDPGYRTGCKTAVIDRSGNFMESATIFPAPPFNDEEKSSQILAGLCEKYKPGFIAVGNGTASRETMAFVRKFLKDKEIDAVPVMVNESGASVYSASDTARREFPELDLTVRGAISIARRLQDPLAELVKIEPKSIGVGQYQHDVDQRELGRALRETVFSAVNFVGVNLNTASPELLTYVSGFTSSTAEAVSLYRRKIGAFRNLTELNDVKGIGKKAFEQSAGFLRIVGDEPLDNTGVHPESYEIVRKMASDMGTGVSGLAGNKKVLEKINPEKYITEKAGMYTLTDIIEELEKPGIDPRKEFSYAEFRDDVCEIEDLSEGMLLEGVVTNLTRFGAFVDIGVHQDGLVHISHLA